MIRINLQEGSLQRQYGRSKPASQMFVIGFVAVLLSIALVCIGFSGEGRKSNAPFMFPRSAEASPNQNSCAWEGINPSVSCNGDTSSDCVVCFQSGMNIVCNPFNKYECKR